MTVTALSWKAKPEPWLPPDYDESTIYAVRALMTGTANDGQQKLVWSYFMYLTGASEEFADLSFRPGPQGERATVFAEGRRFVGLMLRKLLRPELTPHGTKSEKPTNPIMARRQRKRKAS